MNCTGPKDLPSAPRGKVGWPWTAETTRLPEDMSKGQSWPRISVVTPSYNQGEFLEETIRSVLLQGYPDLEYIIIDGASTDHSVEIIKRYEPWLTYWVSEPDRGQSHAINKGFQHASGEILAWLNSDDIYLPGALWTIGNAVKHCREKDSKWNGWFMGGCIYENLVTQERKKLIPAQPPDDPLRRLSWRCPQRSSFWRKSYWDRVGPLSEDLHFAFDTEFFLRLVFSGHQPILLPEILALGRVHPECKTSRQREGWGPEMLVVYDRLADFLQLAERLRVRRAVRADLARVRYHESRRRNRWLATIAAGSKILWYSPPWNRQEGLPF